MASRCQSIHYAIQETMGFIVSKGVGQMGEADGKIWVIQDLAPEDDEEATKILVNHLATDEVLCTASNLINDEISVRSTADLWRICLAQRTSLGCYTELEGTKTLVALNCCIVVCKGDDDVVKLEGEAWKNVYSALKYVEQRLDVYEYYGIEKVLYGMGLVVRRDFRGANLGARILAAREPLALSMGILGTSTIFSGIASQKSAARAGFKTVAEVTFTELADQGLNYPRNDHVVKLMVKKYV